MTTCFIKWDNSFSYKLADPNNTYSIVNLGGHPIKITWDNNQEHIINNPDNYNYFLKATTCYLYLQNINGDKRYANVLDGSGQLSFGGITSGAIFNLDENNKIYRKIGESLSWQGTRRTDCGLPHGGLGLTYAYAPENLSGAYILSSIQSSYTPIDVNFYFLSPYNCSRNYNVISTKITKELINPFLRIIDDNIIYDYSITDTNSIEIINGNDIKKIEIEGNQFDLIDENSVVKDCQQHCPNGLIECVCGHDLCCYKKTNYGYKLIQTIKIE